MDKVDKGFELIYWKLSYRRKFIRTLWLIPWAVASLVYIQIAGKNYVYTTLFCFQFKWFIITKNGWKRRKKIYIYKTEILTVGTKWLSDKADANDIAMLDKLINEKAADGWELVTYDYMATSMQIKGAFVVTFRKKQ